MIIVTGASGKLGGAAVRALLETVPAEQVGVLARSAEKVADLAAAGVRGCDVGDYEEASRPPAEGGVPRCRRSALRVRLRRDPRGARAPARQRGPGRGRGRRRARRLHQRRPSAARPAGRDDRPDAPGFLADHTVTEGCCATPDFR